ncbi:hypothetical protein LMG24235_08441 [Paraburkholderia sabiae]|nr:hypothetical protein LMG24235_08441 [Paraburkholderia sabiae]
MTEGQQIALVHHLGPDVPAEDDLVLPSLDGESFEDLFADLRPA